MHIIKNGGMWLQIKRTKILIQKVSDQYMFLKIKFSQNNKFSKIQSHRKTSQINTFMCKNLHKRQNHKKMIKNKGNQNQ